MTRPHRPFRLFLALLLTTSRVAVGFLPFHRNPAPTAFTTSFRTLPLFGAKKRPNADGSVGSGDNWIERAFPVDTTGDGDVISVEDYNLGISGANFDTGPLSKRMYDAIMKANGGEESMSPEIRKAFTLYAMDFTAKEATRAALKANGLEMAVEDEMQDEGMWGEVDSIQLLDETNKPIGTFYDSTEEAIEHWIPGQGFNFIVRQVPAKIRELSLDELLKALDPDGELRKQAEEANWTLPDEDINSLKDLANDSVRRTNVAPQETTDEANAFGGLDKRGYRIINRGELSRDSVDADGSENQKTLMHVMDALVSHGALVVDLTDGGTTYKDALKMMNLWKTSASFFDAMDGGSPPDLPGMASVIDSCPSAKVGYATYDNDSMQFLETRFEREGGLLPKEAKAFLGDDGVTVLREAFDTVCDVGKDVARIATAASSMEAGAFDNVKTEDSEDGPSISGLAFNDSDDSDALASQAATRLVDEMIDDGKPLTSTTDIECSEGPISMTPLRICRYSNKSTSDNDDEQQSGKAREVFGAHTDSTFITAVPVASVSGLEVYDEAEEKWYRPELAARKHWERERDKRGGDPDAQFETISDLEEGEEDIELPWHCRYVVLLPGEFLQIVTRNEVPAAVHRVVAVRDGPARLSAPILLRGRPGTRMNVERYLGEMDIALLQEVDGMTMDEIHEATQPSSFQ